MLAQKLLSGGAETLYVDECFSAYTYTGNGSTQTITNGIDLAGKGGLVWIKNRIGANPHILSSTATLAHYWLQSNTTDALQYGGTSALASFNSEGFTTGSTSSADVNGNGTSYASWTFRRSPKFFDVVTYTGNTSGGSPQTIAHGLGVEPGLIIIKATSIAGENWAVWHRSFTTNQVIYLNTTAAVSSQPAGNSFPTLPTATDFTVGYNASQNGLGNTYVAYLFAHDTSTDGIIQCGSFTGSATVTLGWEPQYVLYKRTDNTSGWKIYDSMRGWPATGNGAELFANLSQAETSGGGINPTATGFNSVESSGQSYIYLAIRRPNKPPTSGTQVYNAVLNTGNSTAKSITGAGFPPDLFLSGCRTNTSSAHQAFFDRLRGQAQLISSSLTAAELTDSASMSSFNMDGVIVGTDGSRAVTNATGKTYVHWFFRRAVGCFDQVCYTGTGTNAAQAHNLTVSPELVIYKVRTQVSGWRIYSQAIGNSNFLRLNLTNASADMVSSGAAANWTTPTATNFYPDANFCSNAGELYVAYLFATKAGISCVTNYTGNGGAADSAGSSQTINCGFTTGSRFVMLKCTSHTSDWIIVDTVRGLIAGNDPTISLNTTAAEVTGQDLLDPASEGFVVNQLGSGAGTSANFNVTGRTYIVLSLS